MKTFALALLVASVATGVAQQPKTKPVPADGAVVDGELGATLDRMVGNEMLFGKDFSGVVLDAKGADGKKPMRADSLWDWAASSPTSTTASPRSPTACSS